MIFFSPSGGKFPCKMQGNSLRLQPGGLDWISMNFFMKRVSKNWNRLPGIMLEPPSLEVFETCMWH